MCEQAYVLPQGTSRLALEADELVDATSGGIANMREPVDLQDKLNSIKAKIFGNQLSPSPPKTGL